MICGNLGKDTVDYSDKTQPVTVSLDGSLATDPDIVSNDPRVSSARGATAARRSRPADPTTGDLHSDQHRMLPVPGRPPCATASPNDGVPGENDCVGEDVEHIIGSPLDDTLIGNDPDPLYGLGPRIEPSGQNVLTGGGGDDLLDGGLGPDVYIGGDGGRRRFV